MRILYLIFVILLSSLFTTKANAQAKKVIDEDSNYVVIGAFNIYENAVHFVSKAKQQNFNADCAFNENKKLYYVFISKTNDHASAIEEAKKLQAQSQYPDTWVYGKPTVMAAVGIDVNPGTNRETVITATDKPGSPVVPSSSTRDGQAVVPAGGAVVSASGVVVPAGSAVVPAGGAVVPVGGAVVPVGGAIVPASSVAVTANGVVTPAGNAVAPASNSVTSEDNSKKFFFKVFSTVTGDSIKGNIDMINIETNKKTNSYPTNEGVSVKPANKSGNILFTCDILGYRGIKKNVNFNDPLATTEITQITVQDGQFILPFELVRLKKGDIAVMFDLFFYKDAAIIRAESRSEVGLLVDMMKENLKYKILLHGHTNGGGSGKIIKVGPEKNFFSLTGSKDGYGSAMKLSEERADVVKAYLIAQGIDEKRIEVKGWGGKKPVYDVEHALAQSNVRVEVEILEDK